MNGQPTTLEVAFDSPEALAREFRSNISNGGVFVATTEPFEVRQKVRVRVVLHFARKSVKLEGEVVHVVSEAVASAGAELGVAVHFDASVAALRKLFEPFLGEAVVNEEKVDEDDRRAAPRSRARVSARVSCPGCEEIVGRTRDLSMTGVLVSVEGEPSIDVGEPVQVFITDPETGNEQEILGKVARHIRGDGGVVRAVAVHFHIPEECRDDVESFVADLAAQEHSRHLGGIKGTIEELGLINLVQTFGLAAREGTLDVMRGAEEGYLAFEGGTLVAARLGSTRGVKALARMLSWSDGAFEFHARIDPTLPSSDAIPLEAALLDAMRLMDESHGVDRSQFPPDAVLHVNELQRAEAGALSKLDESLLDLAATGMNLQRVLDIVPETDDEIFLALEGLVDGGLLEVWKV